MAGPGQSLREVHRLRQQLKNLQDGIDRAPRQLKAQQAKVVRHEEILREAQESLKKIKISIHDGEVSLKAIHGLIAKHRKQLSESGGKKEYDALQSEIAAEQQKLQRLEEQVLNSMGESEERTAQMPDLEKNVQRAKTELADFQKESGEQLADLTAQLIHVRQQLKEVEATLPDEIRPQYDRVIAARGEDALSLVKDRTCSACCTSITAQNHNDLLNGRFILCKSCGRILYLAE